MINIITRFDADQNVGLGHYFQTKEIICSILKLNKNVNFICLVNNSKFLRKVIENNKNKHIEYRLINRLGLTQEVNTVTSIINETKSKTLITSLLNPPDNYFSLLRSKNEKIKIVCLDNIVGERAGVDIIINGNLIPKGKAYNRDNKTRIYSGPKYFILRDSFKQYRASNNQRDTIIISMGGVDRTRTTLKLIKLLKGLNLKKYVVIGPGFTFKKEISKLKKRIFKNYKYLEDCTDSELTRYMFKSIIGLSAGGNTLYEFAYFGLPSIVLWEDGHEKIQGEIFEQRKLGFCYARGTEVDNRLVDSIEGIIKNQKMIREMSDRLKQLVDGDGTKRTVKIIMEELK